MPDTEKTTPQIDPRDARIKELEDLNKALQDEVNELNEHCDQIQDQADRAEARAKDAEKKAKAGKAAPTGDVVFLGGESHAVVGTVRANTTFDEVKKGNVEEGATLVVIAKPH